MEIIGVALLLMIVLGPFVLFYGIVWFGCIAIFLFANDRIVNDRPRIDPIGDWLKKRNSSKKINIGMQK